MPYAECHIMYDSSYMEIPIIDKLDWGEGAIRSNSLAFMKSSCDDNVLGPEVGGNCTTL